MKKETVKTIAIVLYYILFIVVLIMFYYVGYFDGQECNIEADCNAFTSDALNRSYCEIKVGELKIGVNDDVTVYSSFDTLCIK